MSQGKLKDKWSLRKKGTGSQIAASDLLISPSLPVTAMKWPISKRVALGALAPFLLLAAPLVAQDTPIGPEGTQVATEQTPAAAVNADALRKAAQNPVASLISVPIQDNFNGGITPGDTTQNVLNIQPVIPVKFSENWNLIIRWITPIIYQPLGLGVGVSGLGDMQPTFLLSPSKPHKLIWGAGPIIQLPTATSRYTGQGKLAIGPNIVALGMPSHFVLGVLVNNIWSIAGGGSRPDINQLLVQYFVNDNLKKGWYLTSQPIITANWNTFRGQRKCVDGPLRWRCGKNHEAWISASEYQRSGLWQCRPCSWSFALDRSGAVCITVSQVNQGAGEDDNGAKAETAATGATAEEVTADNE